MELISGGKVAAVQKQQFIGIIFHQVDLCPNFFAFFNRVRTRSREIPSISAARVWLPSHCSTAFLTSDVSTSSSVNPAGKSAEP